MIGKTFAFSRRFIFFFFRKEIAYLERQLLFTAILDFLYPGKSL